MAFPQHNSLNKKNKKSLKFYEKCARIKQVFRHFVRRLVASTESTSLLLRRKIGLVYLVLVPKMFRAYRHNGLLLTPFPIVVRYSFTFDWCGFRADLSLCTQHELHAQSKNPFSCLTNKNHKRKKIARDSTALKLLPLCRVDET